MKRITILILTLVLLISVPVGAFELETNLGKRGGYANYTINDSSDNWQSLLEFPLDYYVADFNYYNELNMNNFKSLNISYLTNITSVSNDPFIDSDWMSTEGEGEPDIYAEAQSKVNMSKLDLKVVLNHNFIKSKDNFFGAGFGYKSSKHNFMITGPGFQRDNRYDTEILFNPEEELLEYDLEIKTPYLLLNTKNDSFEGNLKIYPKVSIYDFDHHILRGKYNEGDSEGKGIAINLKYKKSLNDRLRFNAQFDYESIRSEGTQTQWFDDNDTVYEVDHEIEYEHKTFMTGLTYSF